MAIHLVRHAHAGKRSAWSGDDSARPLSVKGHHQAESIGEALTSSEPSCLVSSPAIRCVETLAPLAERAGVDIETSTVFAEGADPARALRWLLDHAAETPVACSHGDVIPAIIRLLFVEGMRAEHGVLSQKGSVWSFDVDGDTITHGTYFPPAPILQG